MTDPVRSLHTRLLITGGAGYIGSHAVYAALDSGYEVVVIDNLSTGRRENLPPEVPFVHGNVADPACVEHTLATWKPDGVLHFAGSVVVPESILDPIAYYRNNTQASLNLIDACVRQGIRAFVFSSTAAVYGPLDDGIACEDTPTRPITPYGHSKRMSEQFLEDVWHAHHLPYAVLRYFNVAGADTAGRTGQTATNSPHLIKVACETVLGKRPLMTVFGTDYDTPDGTCIRDFIHVSDLVKAHLRIFEHVAATGQPVCLNCGNGRGYSVREVIAATERAAGRSLPWRAGERRPGDCPRVVADTSAWRQIIGEEIGTTPLDEIIRTTLAWECRPRLGPTAPPCS